MHFLILCGIGGGGGGVDKGSETDPDAGSDTDSDCAEICTSVDSKMKRMHKSLSVVILQQLIYSNYSFSLLGASKNGSGLFLCMAINNEEIDMHAMLLSNLMAVIIYDIFDDFDDPKKGCA